MSLDELKTIKRNSLQIMCHSCLSESDWKIIRHAEQTISTATFSLSTDELSILIKERQAIRDKYHELLIKVEAAADETDLNAISWS